ncbi:hypothetical protein L208DRAFT_261635 [Tricholoma matsutake]|nr:hypothetical protein L208DRAFT_261635 [Tricholoma matsutake 945]
MPKLSWQAKAQRASVKRGFDSGLTDNPFECLLDPDYEPSTDDADKNNDSGNELTCEYVHK